MYFTKGCVVHFGLKLLLLLLLLPLVRSEPLAPSYGEQIISPDQLVCEWVVKGLEIDCNGMQFKYEEHDPVGSKGWWLDFTLVLVLILFAGLSSGLTMAMIGMNPTTLEILAKAGTKQEQEHARKILPLLNHHHLLLVTLLLATASAEEAMPIFLEKMMPAWLSIIVSVSIVLIVAEVIPMAICTRYGLAIGGHTSWIVWGLIGISFPISWPISKVLDLMFGHTAGTLFKRSQLKELINMHGKNWIHTAEDVEAELKKLPAEERLSSHEVQLIKNALDLNSRTVLEISTIVDEVYMLEASQVCDREVIGSIVHFGLHFRVPVYRRNRDHIIGVIRVGDLITLNPDDNMPLEKLELDPIPKIVADTPVYKALTMFQSTNCQVAVVVDSATTKIPISILTIEDIVEELVQGQLTQDMELFSRNTVEGENVLEQWMESPPDDDLKLSVLPDIITPIVNRNETPKKSVDAPVFQLPITEVPSPHWTHPSLSTSSSTASMTKPKKLIPVPKNEIELEEIGQFNSSVEDQLPPATIIQIPHTHSKDSLVSLDTNQSIPITTNPNTLNPNTANITPRSNTLISPSEKKRRLKEPSTANLEKKIPLASAVAVALKKSSSSLTSTSSSLFLPHVFKRGYSMAPVADASIKSGLSASHGDIEDEPFMKAPVIGPLSASHGDDIQPPDDEDMVELDLSR